MNLLHPPPIRASSDDVTLPALSSSSQCWYIASPSTTRPCRELPVGVASLTSDPISRTAPSAYTFGTTLRAPAIGGVDAVSCCSVWSPPAVTEPRFSPQD